MSDLTELGLKKPGRSSAAIALEEPPLSPAAARIEPSDHGRADAFVIFLDRLMEVLGQLAPESEAGELDTFRTRIREYRDIIADRARRGELGRVTDACIAMCRTYLEGGIDEPNSHYFTRSPIHYVDRAKTPCMSICGALDKSAPPVQAVEFHNALLEHGVRSELVTYPGEGHGISLMPTVFDYAARLVGWFEQFMPARSS